MHCTNTVLLICDTKPGKSCRWQTQRCAFTTVAALNYVEKLPVLTYLKHHWTAQLFSPITALAIVIFNHILSLISRPESGSCITLTMVAMSVLLADRGRSSNSGRREKEIVWKHAHTHTHKKKCLNATEQPQRWWVVHSYVAMVDVSYLYHSVGRVPSRRWCEKSKQQGRWVSPVQLSRGREMKSIKHHQQLNFTTMTVTTSKVQFKGFSVFLFLSIANLTA